MSSPSMVHEGVILSCTDVAILDRWLTHVLSVASVDELLA